MVVSQHYIFRLDVTVNQVFIMRILQSACYLLDVGDDGIEWNHCPFGMALAQVAIGRIVLNQERSSVLHAKVQHSYDMGMA